MWHIWCLLCILAYLTVQTQNTCRHVMCNIRCTSREKREDASPQKPQLSAKVQGDTQRHTQTNTHTLTQNIWHMHTKSHREQTAAVILMASLTQFTGQQSDSYVDRENGELCIDEVLIWSRLVVLLHFADNNHNGATPANPRWAALFS